MSIQGFRSQLESDREKTPLLLALRRLSQLGDLKSVAHAVRAYSWPEWPRALHRSAVGEA